MDGTNPPQKNPGPQQAPTPPKPEGGVAFEAPRPTPENVADTPTPAVSLEEVDRELEKAGVNTDAPAAGKKTGGGPSAPKTSPSEPHDDVPSWLAEKKAVLASQSAPTVTPPPPPPPQKTTPATPQARSSDLIRPLRTYKDDIARAIQRSKVSKADVSVAEQQRKLVRMEEERAQLALKEKIEQDRARLAEIRKQPRRESPPENAVSTPPESDVVVPTEDADLEPIFMPQEPQPARAVDAVQVKKSDTYERGELARQAAQIRGVPLPSQQNTSLSKPPRTVTPAPDLQSSVRTQEAELARRQDIMRESQPVQIAERPSSSRLMKVVLGSFIFLLLGAGVLGTTLYIYRDKVTPLTPLEIDTLVFAEQKQEIPVETVRGNALLGLLATRAENTSAPLNAITSLVLTAPDDGERREITTQEFFDRLETRASSGLVRSLHPKYMLGLHSFEGSEPFLVFKTSFYENAFAGMLAWESTMSRDLAPFFGPALLNETTSTATSTATASGIFRDRLINNIDTRVLLDLNGEVRLIYSFIDRQTVVITTNRDTFLEVVNRLNSTRVTR